MVNKIKKKIWTISFSPGVTFFFLEVSSHLKRKEQMIFAIRNNKLFDECGTDHSSLVS